MTAVLGSTAELPCQVNHEKALLVDIAWYFNDRPVKLSHRVQQSADGTLKIEQARNTDVGLYECRVATIDGTERKTARLDVIELPHSPLNVKTELNVAGGLVNVSWSPPFDGNSPIVRYVVEKRVTRNGDGVQSDDLSYNDALHGWTRYPANISSSQRFALLTNLAPAMTYQFRVLAVNTVGEGPPSSPSHPPITLPAQPPAAAPIGLVGASRTSTTIIVQWQPPPNEAHNGLLFGYLVRYKLAGYTDTQWYYKNVTNAAQFSVILEDLIVWRNYEIQVGAYNEIGIGAFSPSIFIRTKEGRPGAPPNNVQGKAINSTAILITWNQTDPQQMNGINQGYRVQAYVFDAKKNVKKLSKEMIVTPHPQQERGQEAIFTDLEPFTQYIISVLCFTSAGDGPPNDPAIEVSTLEDYPEQVSSFKFGEVKDDSIELEWTPPEKVNGQLLGYSLKYCAAVVGTECLWRFANYSADVERAIITGVMPDTNYKFEINAVTRMGAGSVVSASVKSAVAPVEIGELVFSDISMTRVKVSWTPPVMNESNINNQLVGYQVVYETTERQDFGKQVKQRIIDNFLVVSGLKERVSYTFKVRAETTAGLGPERIGNITTGPQLGSPAPPSSVNLSQTITSVRLKWINPPQGSEPLLGYLIEGKQVFSVDDGNGLSSSVSEEDSQWQPIISLRNGPQTEYDLSFNHLSPSSKYTLRIMSVNSKGISEPAFPVIAGSSKHSSSSSSQPTTVIITPSHLAQLRARLPFYREPWFVILMAAVSVVFIVLTLAILCVQSKSYQYQKESMNRGEGGSGGSRDALSVEGFGLDEGPYATGLELRQNANMGTLGRRSNTAMNDVDVASNVRSPPRPSQGSLSYSDEEGDYCETEAKESNIYGSSGDSLTEKPSEISSTGSESESDDNGAHFVNHYANVNDTLRKGGAASWKKQAHPYTVRNQNVYDRHGRGGASSSSSSKQKPSRSAPPVPGRHDVPSSSSQSSDVGYLPPPYTAVVHPPSTSLANHHQHSQQQRQYHQQQPQPSVSNQQMHHPSSSHHPQPASHQQQKPHLHPQYHGSSHPPPQDHLSQYHGNSSHHFNNNHLDSNFDVSSESEYPPPGPSSPSQSGSQAALNGGRIIMNNMPGSRAPLPGFSSFV